MIDYNKALYRRNNAGQPCVWYIKPIHSTPNSYVEIFYGILGKTITTEKIITKRNAADEVQSRIVNKRKTGYMYLADVADINTLPVEERHIIDYLNTYLPTDRQSHTGAMLPMLAKLYDNKNNKLFKDGKKWTAQPKINGLRCVIGATKEGTDMFNPVRLTFQSREGTYWNSLSDIEKYLISIIPEELLDKMLNESYLLDGELYLYGETVNEINSAVKNPKHPKHAFLQYWCYDLAIPEMSQTKRLDLLDNYFEDYQCNTDDLEQHKDLDDRFVIVPSYEIVGGGVATTLRDMFINWGFEGLILRDLYAEYQFGKRNSVMHKYKATTDGKFLIVDIKPEGEARPDIPLLVLKNDINDATFSVHVNGSFEYQKSLFDRTDIKGRLVYITYGERSGVNQLPFHVKEVTIIES